MPFRRNGGHDIVTHNVWATVLFCSALQGFVLSVLLLFIRRGRRLANCFLSFLLLSTVFAIAAWAAVVAGLIDKWPKMYILSLTIDPMFAPLFYFYTRTLTDSRYSPAVFHVIPAVVFPLAVRVTEFVVKGYNDDSVILTVQTMLSGRALIASPPVLLAPAVLTAYEVAYMCMTWRNVILAQKGLADARRNGMNDVQKWLSFLSAVLFVLTAYAVAVMVYAFTAGIYSMTMEHTFCAIRCLLIQLVAAVGFLFPEMVFAVTKATAHGKRSPLDNTATSRYLQRLVCFMENEKPFRDENLRIAGLAEKLSMSQSLLSQMINEHLKVNFFDFVNSYRVREAQSLLQDKDSDDYTLLAIARDAGFNSKASFIRAFKKHAGVLPSTYRLSCRKRC